jgi:hypothetical protein
MVVENPELYAHFLTLLDALARNVPIGSTAGWRSLGEGKINNCSSSFWQSGGGGPNRQSVLLTGRPEVCSEIAK